MKKTAVILVMLVLAALLAGCSAGEAAPAAEEAPAEESAAAALTVGDAGYSMADLEGMDTMTVEYTGKDDTTVEYTGVPVTALLSEAGLEGETVVFTASDGYAAELAMAELEGCADCVVAFDGDSLRMVLPGFPGNVQVKDVVEISMK